MGDINKIKAADDSLLAAYRNGNGGDFLLQLPALEVGAIAVLPGSFEDGVELFRFACQLVFLLRATGQHVDNRLAFAVR